MTLNFRIVENPSFERKEEFIQDWDDGLTYRELSKKYDLGVDSIYKITKNLGLQRRGRCYNKIKKSKEPSYIYHNYLTNKFHISKYINRKNYYFGSYDSMEIAKEVVSKLKKCNWDKSKLPSIKKELGL